MSKVDEIMAMVSQYGLEEYAQTGRAYPMRAEIRKAIEALAQPAGEAEPFVIKWPEYSSEGMGCGLEDRGITNRYEAMAYGWQEAIDSCMWAIPEVIYTAPQQSQPLTDEQKQHIHNQTGAGHALICLVESYIKVVTE